ncbi:MAG: Ig-like domain-containing protein [Paludibacteraceae bacterium]|nr:Ig-like domain-containing protein [Paludibacteraceae bacterium]
MRENKYLCAQNYYSFNKNTNAMKNKSHVILSIMLLLTLGVGQVWADDVITFKGATTKDSKTTALTPSISSSNANITLGTCVSTCSAENYILTTADGKTMAFGTTTYYLSQPYQNENKKAWNDAGANIYGTFTIPSGYTYTIKGISHAFAANGSSNFTATISVKDATTSKYSSSAITVSKLSKDGDKITSTAINLAEANWVVLSAGTYTINVTPSSSDTNTGKYFGIAEVAITGDLEAVGGEEPETPADETAPTLSSSVPANSATDAAVEGTIVLTFSEAIASVDGNKFSLSGATIGAVAIDGTDSKKVNVPYSDAENEATVTLSVAAEAVADAAGNKSAALSDISFTTVAAVANYAVTHTLTNVKATSGATGADAATAGTAYEAVFAPTKLGYTLPATIGVTIGGETAAVETDYTWNSTSGAFQVPAAKVTGAIVVTIAGVAPVQTFKSDFTDWTQVGETNEYYAYLSQTNYTAFATAGWMVYEGESTGNAKLLINPATDEAISPSSNTTYGKVKQVGTRYMEFYLTGITTVKFYFHNGGSDERTAKYKLNNGDETDLVAITKATSNSGSITLSGSTNNTIRVYASGDVYLCAMKVTLSETSCAATEPGDISKGSLTAGKIKLTAGTPVTGDTWYWQTAADAEAKTDAYDAENGKDATSAGTYYLRSYNTTDDCWSDAKSIELTAEDFLAAPKFVIYDGSTMSDYEDSGSDSDTGFEWTVTGGNHSAKSVNTTLNGKTYTKGQNIFTSATKGPNEGNTRYITITIPSGYLAKFYLAGATNGTDVRSSYISKEITGTLDESIAYVSTDQYDGTFMQSGLQLPGTYYYCADKSIRLYELSVQLYPIDYSRDLTQGQLSTTCLPNGGVVVGASIFEIAYMDYEADGVTPHKIFFDEVVDGVMEAGMPYVVLVDENSTGMSVFYTDSENKAAQSKNGLVGYMGAGRALVENEYFIYNNLFYYVSATDGASGRIKISNNRAYLNLAAIPGYSSYDPAPGRRRVSMGNGNAPKVPTAVDNALTDNTRCTKVLIDGQLFILRGEKMYDVTGQIVK